MNPGTDVWVNGRPVRAATGSSVAAALLDAGIGAFRTSVHGEARGPLCGMGICHECRVTINGVPHRRACVELARHDMRVETGVASEEISWRDGAAAEPAEDALEQLEADIAVVGAGPAGIAAAVSAAERGRRVVLLDSAAEPGGQIWRHRRGYPVPSDAGRWLRRLERSGAQIIRGAAVVDARALMTGGFELFAERGGQEEGGALRVSAARVVIATGARELFLPFPGWTLPGVIGVGGAQALLKLGAPFAGKRVVVAGTGPLLLPVAAALARSGARLAVVAEQAERRAVTRFALGLWREPRTLLDAARYRAAFPGTRYVTGTWVVRAGGDDALREVTLTDGRTERTLPCDVLCTAFGLVPSTELARLLGCTTRDGAVISHDGGETSIPGVYCAGELAGVGGAELALAEGELSGLSAAGACHGSDARVRRLEARRAAGRTRAAALAHAFAPRAALRALPTPETIICRCEDVPLGALRPEWTARQAKLYTRAGMGPCQGRVCGAALEFLFGWPPDAVRPPIEPVLASTLCAGGASAPAELATYA
ncbi:MAG: FAD-dependent oxidoreductase [Gemmatimonadaceae bacterium]